MVGIIFTSTPSTMSTSPTTMVPVLVIYDTVVDGPHTSVSK